MRNLILILLFVSAQADAQKISFVDTTNEWYVYKVTTITPSGFIVITHTVAHYYYSGRKTINNKDYLTVYAESNSLRYVTKHNSNTNNYDTQSIDKSQTGNILCYVREDSLSGNIYLTDTGTVEYLHYDYNSMVGDTLRPYTAYGDAYFVSVIDSILINNTHHKVMTMQPVKYSNFSSYRCVEGIGSLTDPFSLSIIPSSYHVGNTAKVICFKNQYGHLKTNDLPEINCVDTNLNVLNTTNNQSAAIIVHPQPATTYANIQLPEAIKSGALYLYNQVGQKLHIEAIQDKTLIQLDAPATPGLYYYHISDNTTGRNWQGKILFE